MVWKSEIRSRPSWVPPPRAPRAPPAKPPPPPPPRPAKAPGPPGAPLPGDPSGEKTGPAPGAAPGAPGAASGPLGAGPGPAARRPVPGAPRGPTAHSAGHARAAELVEHLAAWRRRGHRADGPRVVEAPAQRPHLLAGEVDRPVVDLDELAGRIADETFREGRLDRRRGRGEGGDRVLVADVVVVGPEDQLLVLERLVGHPDRGAVPVVAGQRRIAAGEHRDLHGLAGGEVEDLGVGRGEQRRVELLLGGGALVVQAIDQDAEPGDRNPVYAIAQGAQGPEAGHLLHGDMGVDRDVAEHRQHLVLGAGERDIDAGLQIAAALGEGLRHARAAALGFRREGVAGRPQPEAGADLAGRKGVDRPGRHELDVAGVGRGVAGVLRADRQQVGQQLLTPAWG